MIFTTKGTAMKTILLDQDGVLANYSNRLLEIWNEEHPDMPGPPLTSMTMFETERHWPAQFQAEVDRIALRQGFFSSLAPLEGAIDGVNYLFRRGYDVRICTAPKRDYRNCALEKFEWVEKHLGFEMTNRVILTRDKTLVDGAMLIDDKPNITGVRVPTWEHVLFDQPYNRHVAGKRRVNWGTIKEIL